MWLLAIPIILIILLSIIRPTRGRLALTANQKFNKLERELGKYPDSDIGEFLARRPDIKVNPLLTQTKGTKYNG